MGPHFQKGATRIGRDRLPPNHVAILDDPKTLIGAIRELWDYAGAPGPKVPYKIVFRICTDGERDAYHHQLLNLEGAEHFAESINRFGLPTRRWHIIDSEHIAHARIRHSNPLTESAHGHVPVTLDDLCCVPEAISPRNIVSFEYAPAQPRVVYHLQRSDGLLVVVQELRAKTGMVFKTAYKRRQ